MVPLEPCHKCGREKCPLRTCPDCGARPRAADVRRINEELERLAKLER